MIDEKKIDQLRVTARACGLGVKEALEVVDELAQAKKDAAHAARMSSATISEYAAKVERLQSALTAAQKHNAETLRGLRDTLATTAAKANLARAEKAEREHDEARAQAAAMRLLIEQHECAPCPGFDRGADGQDRVRRIALDTNAGRDIRDALAKAEAALREEPPFPGADADFHSQNEHARINGIRRAALAAIRALGILALVLAAACGSGSSTKAPDAQTAVADELPAQCGDKRAGPVPVDVAHAVCDCCAAEGVGNVCECCDECGCAYVKDPCADAAVNACPLAFNLFPNAPHKAVTVDACGSEMLGRELTEHQDATCECCGADCSWRTP